MKALCISLLSFLLISITVLGQSDLLKPQGIYTSNFTITELQRTITYYMPLQYGKQDTYPLLIVLHDNKSNAHTVIKKYGDVIHAKADSLGCIVMYPDAISGHWNSKNNSEGKDSINDVGFISIMLGFFIQQYHCDAEHVYLMGLGEGGNMCQRVRCERSGNLAAVATINTTADMNILQNCSLKKTIPSLNINVPEDMKSGIEKAWDFLFGKSTKNQ